MSDRKEEARHRKLRETVELVTGDACRCDQWEDFLCASCQARRALAEDKEQDE